MNARVWPVSHAPLPRLFWASALILATLLCSPQLALAFSQQAKLSGTGAVGPAEQGVSVALSADGNTAIVGGPSDNSFTGAAWVFIRSGGVWTQQGGKLTGTGAVGPAEQGVSVALAADGNTAIVGGPGDNTIIGAAWVFTRSGTVWTQQGSKLAGTGAVETAFQGTSVALSADGNTAIVGGPGDDGNGAVWVFTRSSGGVWSQQGGKLTGTGAVGDAEQGLSVALSADGNTAILGGPDDNSGAGAAWVFTRSGGVWTQQGGKLAGTGAFGGAAQGSSVALSGDGNTAILGGENDNGFMGAAWAFTRSGTVWTQQGSKLVGTGAIGNAVQGASAALSGDGNTAIVGGFEDNSAAGAAWVFVQGAMLQVSPATGIAASGIRGQRFSPASFSYQLSSAGGSIPYSITGIPSWLIASFTSGTLPPTVSDTFTVNACGLAPGSYNATIAFANTSGGQGNTTVAAALTVNPGSRNDCKDFGWRNFICSPGPFKNVFQCNKHFGF